MNDLPTRRPADPPIPGPHVVLHDDGTRQTVFAGPNTWPRRPRWQRATLRVLDWLLLPASFAAAVLLTLAWGSLDTRARLAVTALTLCTAVGHWTIRRTRRRKVRN